MGLDGAREALRAEQRITTAELEAFETFRERVSGLTPPRQTVGQEARATTLVRTSHSDPGAEAIRTAYEETVMAVDHYDTEYGEGILENIHAELGAEYAELFRADVPVTAQMKQGFLLAAAEARERRAGFMKLLDEEGSMLDRVERLVNDTELLTELPEELRFDCLWARYDQLDVAQQRAESILADRQEQIHSLDIPRSPDKDPVLLNEFLYGTLPTTFPILRTVTHLLSDVRTARQTIAHRVAYQCYPDQ